MPTAELPRLLAIFLVVFDDLQGGKVAFQVPEGSVTASSSYPSSSIPPTSASRDISPIPPGSSLLSAAAHAHRNAAFLGGSRQNRNAPLFELSHVEQYILPRRPLVKHLVTICVEQCKVIGFPVWIDNQAYPRGRFMCSWASQQVESPAETCRRQRLFRFRARCRIDSLRTCGTQDWQSASAHGGTHATAP